MAVAALAHIRPRHPEQGLLVAAAGAVDRDGDGRATGLLSALDVMRRHLELVGGVKLHPDRPAARLDDVLYLRAGLSGEDHQMVTRLGGLGNAGLAIRMIALVAADRA